MYTITVYNASEPIVAATAETLQEVIQITIKLWFENNCAVIAEEVCSNQLYLSEVNKDVFI